MRRSPPFSPARPSEALDEGRNPHFCLRVTFSEPRQYADAPHPLRLLGVRRGKRPTKLQPHRPAVQ